MAYHGYAGAGRGDDDLGTLKGCDKLRGDLPRLIPISGIKAGLATTSLGHREVDLHT